MFNSLKEKFYKNIYIKKIKEMVMNIIKENYIKYKLKEKEINKVNLYKYIIKLTGINKYFPDLKETYYFILTITKDTDNKYNYKIEIHRDMSDILNLDIPEEEKEKIIKYFENYQNKNKE